MPLLVDPIIMIGRMEHCSGLACRHRAVGNAIIQELLERQQTGDEAISQMVFITGNPQRLTDSFAALMLTWGYGKYDIRKDAGEKPDWYMQELNGISRGFRSLKKFMKNQKELIELPQVSDLRQFIESDAVFTFSRFSEYHALPRIRKINYTFPIPTQEITTTPCYISPPQFRWVRQIR